MDVYAMRVDQADHDSVVMLKEQIQEKFGKLDVFVNNAVSRPMTGYNDAIEHFSESMRVNATGMMNILRVMARPHCRNRRRKHHQYQLHDGYVWP